MNYTHEEVKAIIKFVLEEERLIEAEETNEAEVKPEVTAVEQKEVAPDPEKKQTKKPGPKPKKAKPIDHGKIMALHNGRWTVKAIAEEMRISEQTVRNHIAMEQKKKEEAQVNGSN